MCVSLFLSFFSFLSPFLQLYGKGKSKDMGLTVGWLVVLGLMAL